MIGYSQFVNEDKVICGYCDNPVDRPVEDYQRGLVCAQHIERGEIEGPDNGIDPADLGYELTRDARMD